MWHNQKEVREMLQSIMLDGIRYMCARGVIVQYDGEGFTMEVDKEEYGWYPDIKSIVSDIMELQDERPFPMRGDSYYEYKQR